MKKKLLNTLLLSLFSIALYSQDFLGLSTGNYAGVTGVLLQPASIVDSRYKFDINIFSTGINYSNNYFLLNRDAILKFNKNNFSDYETFKARYLSEANLGTGERAFFNITNRTQLPLSFMATLSKKSAIAFNMQSRSMIQGRNITQELAQMAYNGFYYQPLNNRPLNASGLSINALNWVEAGLTYARVLYSSDKHFVKAAFTGKYLGGVASINLGSDNFRIGVNTDSSINFSATNFRYNHNEKADFDLVFDKNFRPDASAFGFDAGLVYEYRGNLKNNKYIRNDDDVSYEADRRDVNKYIFKLGVSLLDMGMFTFNKPANVQSFNADVTGWNVRNSNYSTIKQFDTALAARVNGIAGDPRNYNVYLPGALSVQLDIRFVKGLYLNAMAYRPLSTGADAGIRFDNYGYYAITPRYERRHFGIYLPYSFADKNSITNYRDNRLGATLRVGPLFIGSSNLGSMLFNNNLRAADVHLGLKLGITYGKPSKVSRFFERKETTVMPLPQPVAVIEKTTPADTIVYKRPDSMARQNRVAVDYAKGLVYGDDSKGNIIIINNNYYYDTSSRTKNTTAARQVSVYNADSATLRNLVDSLQRSATGGRLQADSADQKLRDSITQKKLALDSLIKNLQLLRQDMDSSNNLNGINDGAFPVRVDTLASKPQQQQQAAVAVKDSLLTTHLNDTLSKSATATKRTDSIASKMKDSRRQSAVASNSTDTTLLQEKSKKKIVVSNRNAVNKSGKINTSTRDTITQLVTIATPEMAAANTDYRDDLYQKYLAESASLQAEISALRQRQENNRRVDYPSPAQYSYPVAVPQQTYAVAPTIYQPAAARTVRDTIYIRDTVRIKDTIKLRDTLTIADTLVMRDTAFLPAVKQPAKPQLVRTDTVTKSIDYRTLPPENILFSSGQSAVRKVYNSKLNYIASILKKDTTLTLSITGHTDPTGPVKVNEALSLKRALAVKNYFSAKGISDTRLQTPSAGSGEPVITGTSKEANSQNRRVVIQIR